jgi:hypothetical protein
VEPGIPLAVGAPRELLRIVGVECGLPSPCPTCFPSDRLETGSKCRHTSNHQRIPA